VVRSVKPAGLRIAILWRPTFLAFNGQRLRADRATATVFSSFIIDERCQNSLSLRARGPETAVLTGAAVRPPRPSTLFPAFVAVQSLMPRRVLRSVQRTLVSTIMSQQCSSSISLSVPSHPRENDRSTSTERDPRARAWNFKWS